MEDLAKEREKDVNSDRGGGSEHGDTQGVWRLLLMGVNCNIECTKEVKVILIICYIELESLDLMDNKELLRF